LLGGGGVSQLIRLSVGRRGDRRLKLVSGTTDLYRMAQALSRRTSIALGLLAALAWLVAVAFSLVASPDYTLPVSLALCFAVAHFVSVATLLRRGTTWLRFTWLLLSLALAVFTLDNLGRLSYSLGGPLFRILI